MSVIRCASESPACNLKAATAARLRRLGPPQSTLPPPRTAEKTAAATSRNANRLPNPYFCTPFSTGVPFRIKEKEAMQSRAQIQGRLDEINREAKRFLNVPFAQLSEKQIAHVAKLADEEEHLRDQMNLHRKAASMMSYASPAEWGREDTNPGDDGASTVFKSFGPGGGNRIRPTSLYEMDSTQVKALQQAGRQGTPFKVQIGSKGIEHGYMDGLRTKAAVTEGGLTPNLLPPIQQPGPRGFWPEFGHLR